MLFRYELEVELAENFGSTVGTLEGEICSIADTYFKQDVESMDILVSDESLDEDTIYTLEIVTHAAKQDDQPDVTSWCITGTRPAPKYNSEGFPRQAA